MSGLSDFVESKLNGKVKVTNLITDVHHLCVYINVLFFIIINEPRCTLYLQKKKFKLINVTSYHLK